MFLIDNCQDGATTVCGLIFLSNFIWSLCDVAIGMVRHNASSNHIGLLIQNCFIVFYSNVCGEKYGVPQTENTTTKL